MNSKVALFWFRRDLRLQDNHGLYEALKNNDSVLPVFIFDQQILDSLSKQDARVEFIHKQLIKINKILKSYGSQLAVYNGTPETVFKQLLSDYEVSSVYCNHDYEPYALSRDKSINDLLKLKSIPFHSYKDQVIFERNQITKDDGLPYKVYTPYSKKWLAAFDANHCKSYKSEDLLEKCYQTKSHNWVELMDLGFEPSPVKVAAFDIDSSIIENYEATRNFPAVNGTSKLGPHLRFGTVSIRQIVSKAIQFENTVFLKELIWREFFMQILWHFPHT